MEVVLTFVIGVASAAGLLTGYRWRTSLSWTKTLSTAIVFAILELAALRISFLPLDRERPLRKGCPWGYRARIGSGNERIAGLYWFNCLVEVNLVFSLHQAALVRSGRDMAERDIVRHRAKQGNPFSD